MGKFNKLKAVMTASEAEFTAFFEKGNKAAGTRAQCNATVEKRLRRKSGQKLLRKRTK